MQKLELIRLRYASAGYPSDLIDRLVEIYGPQGHQNDFDTF